MGSLGGGGSGDGSKSLLSGQSRPLQCTIRPLNRLAYPKGKLPRCELTGGPAEVECVCEHITLCYASEEHAEQAWYGIIHKIAPLLGPLRSPPTVIGSEADRLKRDYIIQMSKRALIDLCKQEASKVLVQGRYDLAIPGAVQALTFCKEIFGEGSIEMVPPYLLLSQANLGLARLQSAEEFLSLANWIILKNPDCPNAIRSQLHRNFGKLYTAQNKPDDALAELAKDIYCSSLEVGPEHIDTSAGYFLMANVLYSERKVESALAFYDKVVDIWYKFLASVRNDAELGQGFGEAQLSEGQDMLSNILKTRINLLGETHIASGEAKYTVALLHVFLGDQEVAKEQLESAFEIYKQQLGEEHPSTMDVASVLARVERADHSANGNGGADETGLQGRAEYSTESRQSLSSQFPASNMMRAVTQSPIPLAPDQGRPYAGHESTEAEVGA